MQNSKRMDDLIFKIAKEDLDEDREEFYGLMVGSELFSPIKGESSEKISFQVVKLEGKRMIHLFTERESFAGKEEVAGMPGFRALEMALKSEGIDGILLQSLKKDSWFAISTPAIEIILKHRKNS